MVGDGTALLHRAYAKVGLDPARMPIASLTTCEAEVQQMGADIAEGHITSAPYFQSVANPVNERCVAAYKQRFGAEQVTNQCWEAAYFQTHLLADAMRRVDSDSVADVLRVLPGSEFAAPQGKVRIDEHNHHTYLRPRIGRINARGQFDILEETRALGSSRSLPRFAHAAGLVRARAAAGAAIGGHEEQQRHAAPAARAPVARTWWCSTPRIRTARKLIGQLHRIGCRVQAFWPPLDKLPDRCRCRVPRRAPRGAVASICRG